MAEIEHDTGHDIHFLSRLERVTLDDMDLALRLYRAPRLLRRILGDPTVPADAARIAIALSAADPPPYVLVERSGAFVTCLAAGMEPGELPVVPFERVSLHLDRAERRAEQKEAALALLDRDNGKRLVARLSTAGAGLTREEFGELVVLEPFLRSNFVRAMQRSYELTCQLGREVARIKRPRATDEPLLRRLWQSYWSFGHLTLLTATGGRPRFAAWEALPDGEQDEICKLFLSFLQLGETPLALRVLWLLSRASKVALAPLKRALQRAETPDRWMMAALALFALACAQRKLRAEAARAIGAMPPPALGSAELREAIAKFFRTFGKILPDEETMSDFAGPYLRRRAADLLGGREHRPDLVGEGGLCAAEIAFALHANSPGTLLGDTDEILRVMSLLPALGEARAEDFYLPRQHADDLGERFSVDRVCAIASPFRPDGPTRAAPVPGRNEPCPCGSGKKYKRCCLGGTSVPA